MRISELIGRLKALEAEHGDLRVCTEYDCSWKSVDVVEIREGIYYDSWVPEWEGHSDARVVYID